MEIFSYNTTTGKVESKKERDFTVIYSMVITSAGPLLKTGLHAITTPFCVV